MDCITMGQDISHLWIAQFISCDPLSAKYAQLSPYNYSDNNPINDPDIDGMHRIIIQRGSEGNKQPKVHYYNKIINNNGKVVKQVNGSGDEVDRLYSHS
ncbi:MAG: hypothetical protein R2779_04250 [Crocinitomicaceae bacterium]